MINYYFIIIILLVGLIMYNKPKKNIEKTTEQKVLNLEILENQVKKRLENLSRENQKFFFCPGNDITKLNIMTNLYTYHMMP